jgi:hypothetical protein
MGLQVVCHDVVGTDRDVLGGEPIKVPGVDVDGDDMTGRPNLVGEPRGDRTGSSAHLQASPSRGDTEPNQTLERSRI